MAGMLEYKCPCCDGAIQFDSATQKMKCPYCDTEFDVDTLKGYDEELKDEKPSEMEWATPGGSWAEGETAGLHTYSCKSCGGEIVGDDTMAASACPFCGNPIVLTGQFAGTLRPDLIIPFKLDKKAAKAKLQEHLKGKTLLPLRFTMSRDRAEQAEGHRRAADAVRPYLEAGQDVAMAILGDVSIYSTYCYMMELLKAEGFPCVMVPGVPSFCAVAARLGRSLTEPDQPLHIIPGGGPGLGEALDLPGSKVLMKAGRNHQKLLEELEARKLLDRAAMVENCGLPEERPFADLTGKPDSNGYFTTVIIP